MREINFSRCIAAALVWFSTFLLVLYGMRYFKKVSRDNCSDRRLTCSVDHSNERLRHRHLRACSSAGISQSYGCRSRIEPFLLAAPPPVHRFKSIWILGRVAFFKQGTCFQVWYLCAKNLLELTAVGRGIHILCGTMLNPSADSSIISIACIFFTVIHIFVASLITNLSIGIISYSANLNNSNFDHLIQKNYTAAWLIITPQSLGLLGEGKSNFTLF